ncbi:hypothetical protein TRFO_10416 [Tritrichomonas foetus]|uniref:Thioredoxin domain-containing protein n=1 Tax=Tritrichomonas foetus TaxID=1144522 RepID=A0A1J4J8L9_9EUKA|nr:hypothetical protein TRFO_10416 [Tritrichomonas foetus]|eukprot:OHS95538.1 hypothetical protein TRFO_10416 [Tritrichomonas foetus]
MLISSLFFLFVVLHPTESNFKIVLKGADEKPLFVLYTNENSEPSRRLVKRWKAFEEIYEKNKTVFLADVSCTAHKQICIDQNIRVCPIIRAYIPGNTTLEFNGPREQKDIGAWINKIVEKPVRNHSSISTPIQNDSVTFVLYDESFYQKYYQIAYQYKNTSNHFIFSPKIEQNQKQNHEQNQKQNHEQNHDLNQKQNHDLNHEQDYENTFVSKNGLVAYMGNSYIDYFDLQKDLSYENFIWKHQFPLCFELTKYNYLEAAHSNRLLAILLINPAMKHKKKIMTNYKDVAKEFHDKFVFGWMDAITYGEFLTTLNIFELPSVVIIDEVNEQHYVTSSDPEMLKIELSGLVDGSIKFETIPKIKKVKFFTANFLRNEWPVLLVMLVLFIVLVTSLIIMISGIKSMRKEGISLRDCFIPIDIPKMKSE